MLCRNSMTLLFLGVLSLSSCSLPTGENDRWTVMSWNVQNLFDGIDDGNEYAEFDPSSGDWNDRLFERRLDRTAEVCLAAVRGGPDLIIFQELEKPEILDRLADGPLSGKGYDWRVSVPGYSIIRCGILSRYPLSSVSVIDCGYWGNRPLRPVTAVTVDTPGGPVRVVALHWKSPRDGRSATESTRIREARKALSMYSAGENRSNEPLLMIGDLNTPGDGKVLPAALCPWEPDIDQDKGVIFRTSELEGTGFHDGIPVFYDPEPDPMNGSRGTYWYREDWDRPDRALLSEHFIRDDRWELIACRAGGIPIMETSSGIPQRWFTSREEGYSDHLPLILEFAVVEKNTE